MTAGDVRLKHESEPTIWLASIDIGDNRRAQLLAHGEPEGFIPGWLNEKVAQGRKQAEEAGVTLPDDAYGYFLSALPDGSRFLGE